MGNNEVGSFNVALEMGLVFDESASMITVSISRSFSSIGIFAIVTFQVANKDVALPIVTEIRDLMKSQKGVNLKTELARLFDEKLKLTRSQLTFETVHLFMMALRECQVKLLINIIN